MEVGIRQGVCNNSPAEWIGPENGWRSSVLPIPRRPWRSLVPGRVGRRGGRDEARAETLGGTALGADLGGSSRYSNGNFED